MIERVVTGGETGADQGAWAAARRAGVATGGYMPRGFRTEAGPAARLGQLHGAVEFPFDDARRIRANLRRAGGLAWFGDPESPEARQAFAACEELSKPSFVVDVGYTPPAKLAGWLDVFEIRVLVVSGDRESERPGVGAAVESFLGRTFVALRRRGGG
ncbi:putative molybdenum carrier protein [Paludisphaera sp.]|uniref:YpsA SLOG family protein n=1 Tax=Paludisphaera sp. TaxID=2017432 RepID=UPI00301CF1EF